MNIDGVSQKQPVMNFSKAPKFYIAYTRVQDSWEDILKHELNRSKFGYPLYGFPSYQNNLEHTLCVLYMKT